MTLYRERTPAEWAALLPMDRIREGRGESDYGFVADPQAEQDAALGKAVRAAFQRKCAEYGWPEDVALARTVGVGLAVMSTFAGVLEAEAKEGQDATGH